MSIDLDELERIGTSALVHNRVPCDLSEHAAINRWISTAANNWQAMIDEIRRSRDESMKLATRLANAKRRLADIASGDVCQPVIHAGAALREDEHIKCGK